MTLACIPSMFPNPFENGPKRKKKEPRLRARGKLSRLSRLSRLCSGKYLEKRELSFYSFVAREPKAKLEFAVPALSVPPSHFAQMVLV